MKTDYLKHYGVKGMKWGVRRWQNNDGTLTDYGISRLRESAKAFEKDNKSRTKDRKFTDNSFIEFLPRRYVFERKETMVGHIVDKYGKVQMSYITNTGNYTAAVARGKKWCDEHLKEYFHHPDWIKITYLDK